MAFLKGIWQLTACKFNLSNAEQRPRKALNFMAFLKGIWQLTA
jgi:hypothetical protein